MNLTLDDGDGDAAVGQTARFSIQVTDRDGDLFRTDVVQCINVTTDADLREALIDGTLHEVGSPTGADTFRLAVPVCYHDPQRRLFALVIPDELRHREFELRRQLLNDLEKSAAELPDYIRRFATVCGVEALERLERRRQRAADESRSEVADTVRGGGEDLDGLIADGAQPPDNPVGQTNAESPAGLTNLEDAWHEIDRRREQLDREREQLDQVADRIERERRQMDTVEHRLADQRACLEEERAEIEAMKINVQQQRLRVDQHSPKSHAGESTQVVTDDQFVEVIDGDVGGATVGGTVGFTGSTAGQSSRQPTATQSRDRPPQDDAAATVADIERTEPARLDHLTGDESARRVAAVDDRVVARAPVSDDELAAIEASETLAFYVQYSDRGGYPIIGLVLAALDADQQAVASVGWPLDLDEPSHADILTRLESAVELHSVLVDSDGQIGAAFDIKAPLDANLAWIRRRAQSRLDETDEGSTTFLKAAAEWAAPDHQRVGSMVHNFSAERFGQAASPADIQLASGIVGYWSVAEHFEYLVANRSFPLDRFETMRARIVRRAVEHGIFLNGALRRVAVGRDLAADEVALTRRLIAQFAELSIGLSDHDLDPIQHWDNWQDLIDLADRLDVDVDADVVDLAEASLERAQAFQSARVDRQDAPDAGASHRSLDESPQQRVVEHWSESTGMTYFLPDDAVIKTLDDLGSIQRDELEKLLDDPNERLKAAEVLVGRFGVDGLDCALDSADDMNAAEMTALARFVQARADQLQPGLIECVEECGPNGAYVAARALAASGHGSSIPSLLEAYRDPARRGGFQPMARAMAEYGDQLLPQLKRTIKADGHDEATVVLLQELDRAHQGLLVELAKDRSKKVRHAANDARTNN